MPRFGPARSAVWLLLLATAQLPGAPVSYNIVANLDDVRGIVQAKATITYRNATTDTLSTLWLHLYPNAFRNRSTSYARELEAMGRFGFSLAPERDRGWMEIDSVEPGARVKLTAHAETELGLYLDPPLAPAESLTLLVRFRTKVPARFGELSRSGRSFVLAHWYPEVAPRNEAAGWLTNGYHVFGHAPAATGDFEVALNLANDLYAAATGRWWRASECMPGDGRHSLQFTATDVSDFAIVAAPRMVRLRDSVAGTQVVVLARYPVMLDWLNALEYVKDIVNHYTEWYGPCPFKSLSVVQADGVAPADASYPGLVVMSTKPVPGTRIFEQALARQIALQWFSCALGPDELCYPWLAQGPAAYAEMRYLEEKYGPTNLLDHPLFSWFFKGLGSDFYHRAQYYVAASNSILPHAAKTRTVPKTGDCPFAGPCATPRDCPPVFADGPSPGLQDPLAFLAENQSKPGLLLRALEKEVGRPAFDSLMGSYLRQCRGTHPKPRDFARYFPTVVARMNGSDSFALKTWGRLHHDGVTVHPIIALPAFDHYQLFYGPYAWIDNYHGVQLCAWAQGRQFIDAGPLRGRHMWTLSETYSTKIRDWHTGFSYQTPLNFISDRLRASIGLDYSLMDAGAKVNFIQEFGPVFRQPKVTFDLGYRLLDLYDLRFRDSRAWDSARTADVRLAIRHTYETRNFKGGQQLYVSRSVKALGSQYHYWKTSMEQVHTFRTSLNSGITVRAFAGYIFGSVPAQDQFYLSGGLTSNSSEPVSWGYEGWTSGQEHWHYDADANCRGWAGEYLHGACAYGLNVYLQPVKFIQPFFDLGNVAQNGDCPENRGLSLRRAVCDSQGLSPGFLRGTVPIFRTLWPPRMDAGIRLKLGPLYADFPIWRYSVADGRHEFAFRWTLGFRLSDLTSGS